MTTNGTHTPRETDEALAELHTQLYRAEDRADSLANAQLMMAGADFYYRGRRRVTDMDVAEAAEILNRIISENEGDSDYARLPTSGGWSLGQARSNVRDIEENDELRHDLRNRIDALEATYTGWSRFFLVISSPGHIHSSMSCSSCRPTTRYGWRPDLSGKTEAEAVAECGPALCTVCFPSAPLDWTGKKLTAAQATKAAA